MVVDVATGLAGMVTHANWSLNHVVQYAFQPSGLSPEDGQPVKRSWMEIERLDGAAGRPLVYQVLTMDDVPLQVLGTQVEDKATGFAGMAISLTLHMSGCVHVIVQPKAVVAKTGAPVESSDFDIRRLKGVAIPELTEEQVDEDRKAKPSPVGDSMPHRNFGA